MAVARILNPCFILVAVVNVHLVLVDAAVLRAVANVAKCRALLLDGGDQEAAVLVEGVLFVLSAMCRRLGIVLIARGVLLLQFFAGLVRILDDSSGDWLQGNSSSLGAGRHVLMMFAHCLDLLFKHPYLFSLVLYL